MKLLKNSQFLTISLITLAFSTTPNIVNAGTLFFDDFDSGNRTSNTNDGYGWGGVNGGPGEDVLISNDIAHSGNYSMKFIYRGGPDTDPAFAEQRYHLGENKNEVYIQWYQYFPNGTEGLGPKWRHRPVSPSNNKFLKLWADSYTDYTLTTGVSTQAVKNSNSGDSIPFTVWGTNAKGGVGKYGADISKSAIPLGKWVKFQFHIKTATSANNDGVIEMWMDDKKVINNQNLDMYPTNGIGNYLRNGYIMGWANSGFDEDSFTYIDDFEISDTYIGANPPSAPEAQ